MVLLCRAHAVSNNIGRPPPRAVVAAEAPPPPFDNGDVPSVTQAHSRARTHTHTDDPPTADRRRPPTCSCSIFIIIIIIIFHSAAAAAVVYAGPTDTAPGARTHLLLGHPRVRRRRGRTVVVSRCIQR